MIQIEISHTYRPRVDLYYLEKRRRWILDYRLPPDSKTRLSVTLPKHYTKSKAVQAKEDKYAQLKEGKLTEKEVQALPNHLKIDEAIEVYKGLTFLGKSNKSKEYDSRSLGPIFSYFKENHKYGKIHEIKTEDILNYRQHLESLVSERKSAEKLYRESAPFVSPEELKQLSKTVQETGLAPATARGRLRDLRKVLNGLFLHKKIQFNPYKNIPLLKFSDRDLIRSVTPKVEELQKLLAAPYKARSNIDFPIKEFVEFLAETGAREDEAIHIEWTDIEDGIWHIKAKPNCPTRFGIGWTPKWGKERKVVLSPRALEVLDRIPRYQVVLGYMTVPKEEFLKARSRGVKIQPLGYPAQFVFSAKDYNSQTADGRRRVESYRKTWNMLLRKASLPDFGPNKLHPHDFRRSKNKLDEYRGKRLKERAENFGHAPKVNQSNYRGEDDAQILAIKAKINHLRFEIQKSFGSGDISKVEELLNQESKLRLSLAMTLGNDLQVLFDGV